MYAYISHIHSDEINEISADEDVDASRQLLPVDNTNDHTDTSDSSATEEHGFWLFFMYFHYPAKYQLLTDSTLIHISIYDRCFNKYSKISRLPFT